MTIIKEQLSRTVVDYVFHDYGDACAYTKTTNLEIECRDEEGENPTWILQKQDRVYEEFNAASDITQYPQAQQDRISSWRAAHA